MSEPGSEGYAASKGGIYSLTHALALSLSEWHITVNSIAPGWIQNNHYEQLRPEDHTQHPSGRVGKPEDIARMCLFLSQEENDFINGENITIDEDDLYRIKKLFISPSLFSLYHSAYSAPRSE